MAHFTRRIAQGVAVSAATGALLAALAGMAGASTLPASSAKPATATNSYSGVGSPQSTVGFNLIDNSAETFDFVKTDGSLPAPPTAPITTGHSVNFEINGSWIHYYSGTAYYNVMNTAGAQIGTMQLKVDNNGGWSFSDTYSDNEKLTAVAGANNPDNVYIDDAVGSPNTSQSLPAGSAAEQSFIQATTQLGIGSSSFGDVTQTTAWSKPTLIAQAYNAQSVSNDLTTGKSYVFQTTDTWGVAVTAGVEIKIFNASVQGSYSHAVTTGTQEDTSYQATVQPDHTTYIWGSVWQYVDTGTVTVKLGNTTWTLPGVTVYNAVPNSALTYSSSEVQGDVPLPAGTVQDNGALFNINTGSTVNR
jgi:hypothetical protein